MPQDVQAISAEGRELLRAAAANQGNLSLTRRGGMKGPAICGKDRMFFDKSDPAVAARYVEALKQLVDLLLLRPKDARQYELTNPGWLASGKFSRAN